MWATWGKLLGSAHILSPPCQAYRRMANGCEHEKMYSILYVKHILYESESFQMFLVIFLNHSGEFGWLASEILLLPRYRICSNHICLIIFGNYQQYQVGQITNESLQHRENDKLHLSNMKALYMWKMNESEMEALTEGVCMWHRTNNVHEWARKQKL